LQILGLLGELPGDSFDIHKWDGTTMHVQVVEQDGQRYFRASHEETSRIAYTLWIAKQTKTVEDIPVGKVPAFHSASFTGMNSGDLLAHYGVSLGAVLSLMALIGVDGQTIAQTANGGR